MTTSSANIIRLSSIILVVLLLVGGGAAAFSPPGTYVIGGGCDSNPGGRGIDIRGGGYRRRVHPIVPPPATAAIDTIIIARSRSAPSSDDDDANNVEGSVSSTITDVFDALLAWTTSELNELILCLSLAYGYLAMPHDDVTPRDVILACDAIDDASSHSSPSSTRVERLLSLRRRVHEFGRYRLLASLMKSNYETYVTTAEFLSPSRIPRMDLPNVQDVEYRAADAGEEMAGTIVDDMSSSLSSSSSSSPSDADDRGVVAGGRKVDEDETTRLVPDCELDDVSYDDNLFDRALLHVFRNLVSDYTKLGTKSEIPGIVGLLAQGREYMTMELPTGTSYADHAEAQHDMVKTTLGKLMTPVLPPFYRLFMSGIIPKLGTEFDGKRYGPWFYAPYLTSIVTPLFFGFLVGPSRPNRRRDGNRGGLVVEKCKFLQESGCKGLCLHQCKIPAQEFFVETLGMELSVRPNFVTQECQWSFGEAPLPIEKDPSFPNGCLVGCESRKVIAGRKMGGGDVLCM